MQVVSEKSYYVYVHKRKSDGTIFYVGKGKGQRCNDYIRRSNWWKKIVNKSGGFIVDIVKINLTEEEAFLLEHELICKYGRIKFDKDGILCNLTNGFDGLSGLKHSKETRQKMRKKALGRKNITDDGRKRIAESNRNRKKSIDGIKNGAIKRSGENNCKSKLILNLETGVYHYTLTEASISYNININTISDHLRGATLRNKTSLIYA